MVRSRSGSEDLFLAGDPADWQTCLLDHAARVVIRRTLDDDSGCPDCVRSVAHNLGRTVSSFVSLDSASVELQVTTSARCQRTVSRATATDSGSW